MNNKSYRIYLCHAMKKRTCIREMWTTIICHQQCDFINDHLSVTPVRHGQTPLDFYSWDILTKGQTA
jgi:hypothetical protein